MADGASDGIPYYSGQEAHNHHPLPARPLLERSRYIESSVGREVRQPPGNMQKSAQRQALNWLNNELFH